MQKTIEQFKQTLKVSTSPFHTTNEAVRQLKASGFTELSWDMDWNLEPNGKYYVCPFGTTIFAFSIGDINPENTCFKLASAHIDNPGLRIKHNPILSNNHAQRLNAEVYGGAIYSTWLDRPLSVAGRVALKNSNSFKPRIRLVDFKQPIAIIPNLAIHLNRKINEGIALNAQTDLLPVCSTSAKPLDNDFFVKQLANKLDEAPDDILCYELCLYNADTPQTIGFENDMIAAPRIDNISSVQACLTGLIESELSHDIRLIALFDHEEIGSRSKNGADSSLLSFTLERICTALGISRENFLKKLKDSYYLSLDVAHAVNPNHPEKSDITTQMALNQGFAVKCSSRHSYCSDLEMTGIIMQLAAKNDIPCQPNYMRSDIPGGSTVGPIVSSLLPVCCADIGIPIYAMHSAMEIGRAHV